MKVPECESCKKNREDLASNPIGGCRFCYKSKAGALDPTCVKCLTDSTPYKHFPEFKKGE